MSGPGDKSPKLRNARKRGWMEIIIEGSRSSSQSWLYAQTMPQGELPSLTAEQRRIAAQQNIPEEVFARSVKARELSLPELASKAEAVGRLLERMMREQRPDSLVQEVRFLTLSGRLDIQAADGGRRFDLKIDEELVDGLLQTGSEDCERRLRRIVEMSLPAHAA